MYVVLRFPKEFFKNLAAEQKNLKTTGLDRDSLSSLSAL